MGKNLSYIALYRKWRPRKFEDVVGQEHITTTLKNQIIYNRIAHAYLFSGTRGTGKTSTAKIFARAVNCPEHESGNPCGNCETCEKIESPGVMDIIEIDAASNRGVDEIRELREKVKYPPTLGAYKVYIIDEVHMLTQEAFNALLKTLEEPPKHVIFILATTEPHKLPATILSRCQRFDFKRITLKDMVNRMKYIAQEMDISIEEKALELIGRNAEGAMRDALSILDQCLSLAKEDEAIAYESVVNTLGLATEGFIYNIAESLLNGETKETIEKLHEMVDGGKDILQIIKQLTEHFRKLLIIKTLPEGENILELGTEQLKSLKNQSDNVEEERLFSFIEQLNATENKIKYTSQPLIILELELIKLSKGPVGNSIEDLLERLKRLEDIIEKGDIKPKKKAPIHKERIQKKRIPRDEPIANERDQRKEQTPPSEEETKTKILEKNDALTIEDIKERWQDINDETRHKSVKIAALLKEGRPKAFNHSRLSIAFGDGFGFHQTALAKKENTDILKGIISNLMESKIEIDCIMEDQVEDPQEDPMEEVVTKAIEVFGEEIVEIVDED